MGLFKDDPQASSAAGNTMTIAVDESVARVIAIKEYSAALGQR
jgi:hypothetical protein